MANLDEYISSGRNVYLSSNGGNVVESLRLALLLKGMYATVNVEYREKCASACFLLYIGAAERYASFKDTLGIHRAYFEPKSFAGMSPIEAEKKQGELTKLVTDFLEVNSVPRSIIETMTGTSSKEIHWLSSEEIRSIGTYPPWYEEFLIAKCSYKPGGKEEVDMMLHHFEAWSAEIDRLERCKDTFINAELKRTLRSVLEEPDPLKKVESPRPTKKSAT